ncbi:MAG: hypothetical protein JWN61_917 [Pseudonocardiales bacterium]|nr:hypothetical protein [Pseudonocardiales bacterium]
MSLLIAIPFAVASAIAYGSSTAVEHSAAHSAAKSGDKPAGAAGLLRLLRNPRWLLGLAGDGLGLIFQVIALATGPVILVQPILILALPVSLPIAWILGGPRPRGADYRSCGLIIVGLSAFFVLVGNPGPAQGLTATQVAISSGAVVGAGALLLLAAQALLRLRTAARAAVIGGVAGAWFGFVAVLLDAVATAWDDGGSGALAEARGFVPLAVLVALGAASIALTQAAFQIGALGASFPANAVADPVLAIILGAALLHEDIPVDPLHIAAYLICLGVVVLGTARLAAERAE